PFGLKAWYDRWLDNAANFAAGVADSLSFGATDWVREQLGWNDAVDHEGGWYIAGEAAEIAAEIVVTGGGAALRHAAKQTSRAATRAAARRATSHIAREGKQLHHINPLFGHPGGKLALFPLGALPAWIHSGKWNLKLLAVAAHLRAHRLLMLEERIFGILFHPVAIILRAILDILRSLPDEGDTADSSGGSSSGSPSSISNSGGGGGT